MLSHWLKLTQPIQWLAWGLNPGQFNFRALRFPLWAASVQSKKEEWSKGLEGKTTLYQTSDQQSKASLFTSYTQLPPVPSTVVRWSLISEM